jgi:thymidylate synthase
MVPERYIEADSLSLAWGRAVQLVSGPGRKEVAPLIVSVTGFDSQGGFAEDFAIRTALDELLRSKKSESVATVANTIFPISLWNPMAPREQLFDRYRRIAVRVQKASRKNSRGRYFDRMIDNGAEGRENQLDFIMRTYRARESVRRSMLQVAVFDPKKDHSAAARLGFPCLQHVTFAPTKDGLSVNAFYATQYMVKRAYGNYVGLCRLGQFVAHELGIRLARVTCYAGIAELDATKEEIKPVLGAIDSAMREHERAV